MTDATAKTPDDYVARALFHDEAAISCYHLLLDIAERADDIADGDCEDPLGELREVLVKTLCALPANIFWARFSAALSGLVLQAVIDWEWATRHQDQGGEETAQSHVMRASYIRILSTMASILGGAEHGARTQEELMRVRIINFPSDHLSAFEKEMGLER